MKKLLKEIFIEKAKKFIEINKYTKENNISLIRIAYDENVENKLMKLLLI